MAFEGRPLKVPPKDGPDTGKKKPRGQGALGGYFLLSRKSDRTKHSLMPTEWP